MKSIIEFLDIQNNKFFDLNFAEFDLLQVFCPFYLNELHATVRKQALNSSHFLFSDTNLSQQLGYVTTRLISFEPNLHTLVAWGVPAARSS